MTNPKAPVAPAPVPSTDPYSGTRIARGVVHLLSGKAVVAVAGIGTFLLLVRSLPIEQFAAYTILFALVELIEAVTGMGFNQALSRYVPELYVSQRRRALRQLVAVALGLRLAVLALVLALLYLAVPTVAPLIGLADWEWALRAYLAVVLVRVVALTLFNVLESMLHQSIAQLGFGAVTTLRFVLLALAAAHGRLDLETVIVIELITDAVGCAIMLFGLVRVMRTKRGDDESEAGVGWLRANLFRMFSFGIRGYFQHLLILPFGGATNRLLVGASLTGAEVALYGFGQSVADLMQRYLPVKLLAGVIRPVLTARYVRDGRFVDLEQASNLIFKLNAVVVCLAAVVVFGGGEPMLSLVTAGRFGDGGVGLLLIMCALVFLLSLRQMLDHVSHAVERNGPLIWSNAVITLSVLPGIALLPTLGVYALPTTGVIGVAAGCLLLIHRLRVAGFNYRQDMVGFWKLLAATGVGFLVATLGRSLDTGWIVIAVISASSFVVAVAIFRPWTTHERQLLVEIKQQLRRK